jgi:superkiller protein 3
LFGVETPSEEGFWRTMVEQQPDSWQAHNHLGALLYMNGNWKDAYPQFQKAVELNPNAPECHNNLGLTLSLKGDMDGAIGEYEKAVKIKEDSAMITNLANAYEQAKRYDEAIKTYEHALAIDPKNASAHCNLGYALMQTGKTAEAIPEFRKAMELDPNMAQPKSDLEKALQIMQMKDEKF